MRFARTREETVDYIGCILDYLVALRAHARGDRRLVSKSSIRHCRCASRARARRQYQFNDMFLKQSELRFARTREETVVICCCRIEELESRYGEGSWQVNEAKEQANLLRLKLY